MQFNKEHAPQIGRDTLHHLLSGMNFGTMWKSFRPKFMSDIFNEMIMLELNRQWQAINIRAPQDAYCQMAAKVATALDIEGESQITLVTGDNGI